MCSSDLFGEHTARNDVIGMTIRPIRDGHNTRAMASHEGHRLLEMRRIFSKSAIGPSEVLAPQSTEDATRRLGLSDAFGHTAVAAHLAACEIAQADALASRSMTRDGAAETNLEIVWVRAKRQQVDVIGF